MFDFCTIKQQFQPTKVYVLCMVDILPDCITYLGFIRKYILFINVYNGTAHSMPSNKKVATLGITNLNATEVDLQRKV